MRNKIRPLMSVNIAHQTPGRIRFKSSAFRHLGAGSSGFLKALANENEIIKVELNTYTGSLLIWHCPEIIDSRLFLELIEIHLSQLTLLIYQNEHESKSISIVTERRLQDQPLQLILKRMIISGTTLVIFGLGNGVKPALGSLLRTRHIPNLISILLSIDIFKSGFRAIVEEKRPNADTLTSSAILVALLTGRAMSALVTILLSDIAEWMTAYTLEKTRGAISDMISSGDDEVFKVLSDGSLSRVPVTSIHHDDIVSIQTGDKFSVDGFVVNGEAYIDEAAITGEYMPSRKSIGDLCYAGTIVKSGQIHIKVTRVGDETTVARIVHMVEDASSKKAQIQTYADRFSAHLIPVNFALSLIIYLYTRDINRSLSMMIIDFSCGVRLSTATALSASIYNAARNGVLIKGGNYIEALAESDSLVLDKTGTITEGKPQVSSTFSMPPYTLKNLIAYTAAAEEDSTHPLAQAIINYARRQDIQIPIHSLTQTVPGYGVQTQIDADVIYVGNKRFMHLHSISTSQVEQEVLSFENQGEMVIYVAKNHDLVGVIGIFDSLKENMRKSLNRLRNLGFDDIRLLTGDKAFHAERVASKMNMDAFEAELLPEDKAHTILEMQSQGSKVIMIGDGINDAPALAYADVGIAIGNTRTDVAIESSNVTITNDDPLLIPSTIVLARDTMKVVKQNFALVVGINAIGIVVSALGFLPVIWGSVLHNSSTIFVVLNSSRLLIKDFERRIIK